MGNGCFCEKAQWEGSTLSMTDRVPLWNILQIAIVCIMYCDSRMRVSDKEHKYLCCGPLGSGMVRPCRLLDVFDSVPGHLTEDLHLYSLNDLSATKNGELVPCLTELLRAGTLHVEKCMVGNGLLLPSPTPTSFLRTICFSIGPAELNVQETPGSSGWWEESRCMLGLFI